MDQKIYFYESSFFLVPRRFLPPLIFRFFNLLHWHNRWSIHHFFVRFGRQIFVYEQVETFVSHEKLTYSDRFFWRRWLFFLLFLLWFKITHWLFCDLLFFKNYPIFLTLEFLVRGMNNGIIFTLTFHGLLLDLYFLEAFLRLDLHNFDSLLILLALSWFINVGWFFLLLQHFSHFLFLFLSSLIDFPEFI